MQTEPLAIMFGVYFLIAGLRVVRSPDDFKLIVTSLRDKPAINFLTGAMVYFLGAIMLILHHDTTTVLATIVTILVALTALKGMLILLAPKTYMSVALGMGAPALSRAWGISAAILGIIFILWVMI